MSFQLSLTGVLYAEAFAVHPQSNNESNEFIIGINLRHLKLYRQYVFILHAFLNCAANGGSYESRNV